MKRIGRAALLLAAAAGFAAGDLPTPLPDFGAPRAEAAQQEWTWIASDQKYGKFYSPSNVQVKNQVNGVPTCISAWIKTSYTPGGAQEVIENYSIQASIPDPRLLSYSLARVDVYPQERKVVYIQENFYDEAGKVIWSKVYEPPKEYEVNSQSYEEDYYVAIVDHIFYHGEKAMKEAPDRWKQLWVSTGTGSVVTEAMADMTTMRLAGKDLIYWEWQETKNKDGEFLEVKHMKKALNYEQGTEKIVKGDIWTPAAGWQQMETDGRYAAVKKESAAFRGLERLRAIVKGYQYWLNRYRVDSTQPANAKKDEKASK